MGGDLHVEQPRNNIETQPRAGNGCFQPSIAQIVILEEGPGLLFNAELTNKRANVDISLSSITLCLELSAIKFMGWT